MSIFGIRYTIKQWFKVLLERFKETSFIIKALTILIVLLPITEVFFVSYTTFINLNNTWRTITIPAGKHSYYPSVKFVYNLEEIEFYFKTDSSWYYPEPERNGWSKLRGFSKGMHHDGSSARLVYKCINDTVLLIGGYCYVNGVHPNEADDQQITIDTVQPGEVYHCIIRHDEDKFKFYFEDKYWECRAGDSPSWGYMLNPFIGGVYTLEHDWEIELLDVDRSTDYQKYYEQDSLGHDQKELLSSGALEPGF
ncbi:MAG: hypothetical protein KDC09_01060 [Bacteroidales bacterium]|nr:hypothetical protein [Bacteroidales bacterium]